jgi:hypothetical protein
MSWAYRADIEGSEDPSEELEMAALSTSQSLVEYDRVRRRLWIHGQRCHHGATGALVAAVACLGAIVDRLPARTTLTLLATGSALMAHDRKDLAIWFERGYGTQP